MIRRVLLTVALSAVLLAVSGQQVENYYVYPDSAAGRLTPAPDGKQPFYISHFGRYTTTYLGYRVGMDAVIKLLNAASSKGKLTETGKNTLREMKSVLHSFENRFGDATQRGLRHQRLLARRMAASFPEVFVGSAVVDAYSTIKARTVLTMGSATQELMLFNPKMRISLHSSLKDMSILDYNTKHVPEDEVPDSARQAYDAFCKPLQKSARLAALLFNDSAYVAAEVDEVLLNHEIRKAAVQQDLHYPDRKFKLSSLLTADEIKAFWLMRNAHNYVNFSNTPLNNHYRPDRQRELLQHIVAQADSCIAKRQNGATLRFGHEQSLLPLLCLLDVNGFGLAEASFDNVGIGKWWSCDITEAPANLQLVFYRANPYDRDILFKVLLNEQEAVLPLETSCWPYYRWADFRQYCKELLKQ